MSLWLKVVPAWAWVAIAGALLVGLQQLRVSSAVADAADAQSLLSGYRAEVAERDRRADVQARTEERRRQVAVDYGR